MFNWLHFSSIFIYIGMVDGWLPKELEKNNWMWNYATNGQTNQMICKFMESYQEKMSKMEQGTIFEKISNSLIEMCQNGEDKMGKIKMEETLWKNLGELLASKEVKNEQKKALESLKEVLEKYEELEKNGKNRPNLKAKMENEMREERKIMAEIEAEKMPEFGEIRTLLKEFLEENGVEKVDEISTKEMIKFIIKIGENFMEKEEKMAEKIILNGQNEQRDLVFDQLNLEKIGKLEEEKMESDLKNGNPNFDPLGIGKNVLKPSKILNEKNNQKPLEFDPLKIVKKGWNRGIGRRVKRQADGFLGMTVLFVVLYFALPFLSLLMGDQFVVEKLATIMLALACINATLFYMTRRN